jgi:hypothetical protein
MIMANTTGNRGGGTGTTGGSTGSMGNMQNAGGGQAGTGVADRARDMASTATGTVRDAASNAADKARDVASNVADTARDWASSAASAVTDKARDVVGSVRDSDVVHKATDYVEGAWESGNRYFQEHNFKDMAEDVAGVIRRNPIPALLVGVGLGFILARSMRST